MRKEYIASGKTLDAALETACAMADRSIEELEIDVLETGSKGLFGIGHKDYKVMVSYEVPDEPTPAEEPAAAPAAGTFGSKKSKRQRFEEKHQKKEQQQFELKPIVTATAETVAEEMPKLQAQVKRAAEGRKERQPREKQADRPARERSEKPAEKADRPRRDTALAVTEGEMADALSAQAKAFLEPIFAHLKVEPEITVTVREGILWLSFAGQNLGLLIGRRGETLNALQYLTNLAVNKHRNDHVRVVLDVEGYRDSREETLAALAHKMAEKAVKSGRRVELEPMNPHERRVVHLALQNDRRVETTSHGEEPYRRVVISKRRSSNRRRRSGRKPNQQRPEGAAVQAEATTPAAE